MKCVEFELMKPPGPIFDNGDENRKFQRKIDSHKVRYYAGVDVNYNIKLGRKKWYATAPVFVIDKVHIDFSGKNSNARYGKDYVIIGIVNTMHLQLVEKMCKETGYALNIGTGKDHHDIHWLSCTLDGTDDNGTAGAQIFPSLSSEDGTFLDSHKSHNDLRFDVPTTISEVPGIYLASCCMSCYVSAELESSTGNRNLKEQKWPVKFKIHKIYLHDEIEGVSPPMKGRTMKGRTDARVMISDLTKYPGIFNSTYWGRFDSSDNPGITDEIIEHRNAFVKQYKITQKCKDPVLSNIRALFEKFSRLFDHLEFYSSSMSPGCVVMVNSPYICGDDQNKQGLVSELVSLKFTAEKPLYHTQAETFIKIFSSKNLVGLDEFFRNLPYTICISKNEQLQKLGEYLDALSAFTIHPEYSGKIIFATPGSGKTHLCLSHPKSLIDADVLLLRAVSNKHPGFRINYGIHPGENLLEFCRRGYSLGPIYEEVRHLIGDHARNGDTILTGSTKLMHMADFVFVQTNADILSDKANYNQEQVEHEKATAVNLGKSYAPIFSYMEDIISRDPACI